MAARDILLMCRDIPVMRINFTTNVYNVLNAALLPYGLKGRIRRIPEFWEVKSHYDDVQRQAAMTACKEALVSWFSHRTLLLSRANAKWIYNALNIAQIDNEYQRLKVAFVCRAVSVLDCYWIKLDGDGVVWDNVDITRNPLNEVIAQIALHGKSLTLQGSLTTPELTTNGVYAKAWRRHADGSLWLYKLGHNGSWESKIEVMCSNLLDKMPVSHVPYLAGEDEGKYVCMCPSIATDKLALLPAMEYISYCNVNNVDFLKSVEEVDAYGYYAMFIVDYLISNRDRHSQNWGFYYDKDTMQIVSLHPLLDHNNAFDNEYMKDPNAVYQCTGMSIRESARLAMRKIDFCFTGEIMKSDFLTDRQWESFQSRAKDLGLM